MYPVLFEVFGFPISTFGVMLAIAFLTGTWLTALRMREIGLDPEQATTMLIYAMVGGIGGSKLYFAVDVSLREGIPFTQLLFAREGITFYGGLLGAIALVIVGTKIHKIPTGPFFNCVCLAGAIGQALGRVGCFLVGDDYGRYTESWVGMSFPEGAPPTTAGQLREWGSTIPAAIPDAQIVTVHPTQLYEVALGLVMFVILWNVGKRSLRTGQLFSLFLILYSIERFFIEFVRAKGDRVIAGLSTSQIASILLFIVGTWLWSHRGRVGASTPTPANPPRIPPDRKPAAAAR